jgi:PadR family transcriptional regulator PadR
MHRKQRRISNEVAAVLDVFLSEPDRRWYGLELIRLAGIPSGSIYPILIRLEERGILRGESEDPALAAASGRRPRRYYRLASKGEDEARRLLAEWRKAVMGRRFPLGGTDVRGATT